MQFKLDENLPASTAGPLQTAGHQVDSVAEEFLEGAYDEILAERCREESRVLITLDLDFADIRAYPPDQYGGIVVLRPPRQSVDAILQLVTQMVPLLSHESPVGKLWIVERTGVRIRGG